MANCIIFTFEYQEGFGSAKFCKIVFFFSVVSLNKRSASVAEGVNYRKFWSASVGGLTRKRTRSWSPSERDRTFVVIFEFTFAKFFNFWLFVFFCAEVARRTMTVLAIELGGRGNSCWTNASTFEFGCRNGLRTFGRRSRVFPGRPVFLPVSTGIVRDVAWVASSRAALSLSISRKSRCT